MSDQRVREVLHIKKYPNRRYYDTTRSRHVTLQEVHDSILAGKDVFITDSRSGEDITNVVLTQILLEKDPPKLDVFPTSLFLMMIRSNRQVLRTSVEPFFAPFLRLFASSQRQIDTYLRQAMSGSINPLDWAKTVMGGLTPDSPDAPDSASSETPNGPDEWEPAADASDDHDSGEFGELRRQVADLTRKLESLSQRHVDGNETQPH